MYVTYVFDLPAASGSGNVFVGHITAGGAQTLHVTNVQVDVLETSTTAQKASLELHSLSAVGTGGTTVTGVKADPAHPKAIGSTAKKGTYSTDPTSSGVRDGANLPVGTTVNPWVAVYPLGRQKVAPSGSLAVVVNRNGASGSPAVKARVTVFEEG